MSSYFRVKIRVLGLELGLEVRVRGLLGDQELWSYGLQLQLGVMG